MDTDDARRASEEIYRRIRQQAGLSRSGSVGDMTLQPEPLGIMTQGKLVLRKRTPEQSQAGQSNVENPETTAGAVGGRYPIKYTTVFYGRRARRTKSESI